MAYDRRIRVKPSKPRTPTIDDRQIYYLNASGQMFNLFVSDCVLYEGWGPDIWMGVSDREGEYHNIDMTNLSHEEFKCAKKIIERMLELVEPIVIARDKRARELEDADGTSFERNYRAVPVLAERPGAGGLDGQELLRRPVNLPNSAKPE